MVARREQFTLDISGIRLPGQGEFHVSPANAEAVTLIEADHLWPGGRLVLCGPEGAGKSHLAALWATRRGSRVIAAETLARPPEARSRSATGSDMLAAAEAPGLVIEDIDRLPGDRAAEEALFHLFNAAVGAGTPLLMTTRRPPARLPFTLPDLASRLAACQLVKLAPPDDTLLAAVLIKLFAERQIAPPPGLIRWLLPRMERSFAAARALVAEIDRIALSEGRPVGRAVAARALDKLNAVASQSDPPAEEKNR